MVEGMPLNQTDIKRLKSILREDCKLDLSEEEVWSIGERLLRLYRLLTRASHLAHHSTRSISPISRSDHYARGRHLRPKIK